MHFTLVMTCWACPEAYDVYHDGKRVGSMRLRHGCFAVALEGMAHECVYEAFPNGDGAFERDERDRYIRNGLRALAKAMAEPPDVTWNVEIGHD